MIKILFTALISACITSCHTYFISRGYYYGLIITAFTISMLSAMHTKWLNDGKISTRVFYSVGATIGCLLGLFISKKILSR